MKTTVKRWVNSLAVRIPKAIAVESALDDGAIVDVKLVGRTVVLIPVRTRQHRLQDLLAGITKDNLYREAETGPPMGNEAW